MGITRWVLAAAAFAAVAAADRPCPAMSESDLTGTTWDASFDARLRLPGVGRDAYGTTGEVTFATNGTFTATENALGSVRTYTGTWRLLSGGNRLKLKLDRDGKNELKDTIVDWITRVASSEGLDLTNGRVRLARATLKTARLPDSLGSFSSKLTATGQASARLGRRRLSSALLYASDLSASPR